MLKRKFIDWLENHRGFVIVMFCLPMSFIFDLYLKVKHNILSYFFSAPLKHNDRVRAIQRDINRWNNLSKHDKKLLCTARPNWLSLSTTFFQKKNCHRISIPLYDILKLDEEQMVVKVEPMVTVRDVTKYLVSRGYTLAVTLEIGDATCGGLGMAVGMTTYSHNVGLYQESVKSYDIVVADGSLINVTADNEHRDLFYCLPWSHGTLGFLVALELKVIPIKPFVHLRYYPVHGQKKYCDEMRKLSGANDKSALTPDFLEATVFNKNKAVIMVGNFAEACPKSKKINNVARWYKPWFYKHVETFCNGGGEEYIPLEHYLLRHNRSIFWVVEDMIPFGNHPLFRFFLGWLCPPKPAFLKFSTTPGIRAMTFTKQVFQDIVLPMTVMENSIDLAEELFDTYPILIYPCRIYDHGVHAGQLRPPTSEQMCPYADYGMFYDLGVYGVPGKVKRHERYDAVYAMRRMEKFIRDSGGYSFLYADIFMTRAEFEEMFDLTLYEKCRQHYQAEGAFPHLFNKVKPEVDVFKIGKSCAQN